MDEFLSAVIGYDSSCFLCDSLMMRLRVIMTDRKNKREAEHEGDY